MNDHVASLEAVGKLRRDVLAASGLSDREARFLVDTYYDLQDRRIEAANQVRALSELGEPHEVLGWLFDQNKILESELKRCLGVYADSAVPGQWAQQLVGVGPIITAGLLAHIDINQAPTVGHIWRFAGLDPTAKWAKGSKRPWNARLKVLCWKLGESFVKFSGRAYENVGEEQDDEAVPAEGTEVLERVLLPAPAKPQDLYAWVFALRKIQEVERNEEGRFSDQAALALEERKIGKDTDAFKWYTQGKLPPARIHLRAKRYAVKLFLSHFHHVLYEVEFEKPPPKPYVLEHLGHVDRIEVPLWPM